MKKLVVVSAGSVLVLGILAVAALRSEAAPSNDISAPKESPAIVAPEAKNQSSSSIDMSTESHSDSSSNRSTTSLKVNGEDIDIPQNGEVHQEITSDGQTTKIDVSHHSSTTADGSHNSQHSSLNISSRSSSRSSSSIDND
jgi:hypothetical protein